MAKNTENTVEGTTAADDKPKRVQGPRPAFMAYDVREDGSLDIKLVSRKADEMLKYVSDNPGTLWTRFEIK